MMFTGIHQIEAELNRLQTRRAEALKHGDSRKVRAIYARALHLDTLADRIKRKVYAEVSALRRMGGGRCRRQAIDLASLRAARMAKFNQWNSRDGGLTVPSRRGIQWPSDTPRPQSLALHKQVIARCTRIVEAGAVEFSVADGKICASVPYEFEYEPIPFVPSPAAQRRIDRLEAWKARQGVHAAFNGKMPVGYWVGEARKKVNITLKDIRMGWLGRCSIQDRKRFMQYARIALHGQVYAFKYHNRFVGYITAMSHEAARREAENQAMLFSPTAPIAQILSGIQLKVGY